MGRMCYLCRRKAAKTDRISLHKFPKGTIMRQKWLRACDLSDSDNLTYIYICSQHFQPGDIDKGNSIQVRPSLKSNAVPSIDVPNPIINEHINWHNNIEEIKPTTSVQQSNYEAIKRRRLSSIDEAQRVDFVFDDGNIETLEIPQIHSTNIGEPATPDQSNEEENGYSTRPTKSRRFFEPKFITKIRTPDLQSPKRARCLQLLRGTDKKKSKLIKCLQNRNKLERRICSLQQIITHLKNKNMMSSEAGDTLLNMMPDKLKDITSRKVKINGEYTPEIRSFAMTLHFYSTKAYNYVRNRFNNSLPHPSTIRGWYRTVDGSPGFTLEALNAIKLRTTNNTIVVNLVLGEMSIREQLVYNEGRFHGCVDFGNSHDDQNDSPYCATSALVLMAVSLNENWKVPIGYFLIRSLDSRERANIVKLAFKELNEVNCKVYSITFDGAASNLSMCKSLGANLNYGPAFKPFFTNPITDEICYIFYDFCHMIKLVRNTLGDLKILKTSDGEEISWHYIEKLHEVQTREELSPANKLTKKHVNFKNCRMNVRVAIQTLSNSVYCSLLFLKKMSDQKEEKNTFIKCENTATFCKNFNDMGDILNCKKRFSKDNYNAPLNDKTITKLRGYAENFENYIRSLCNSEGKEILQTNRKTGFLGMIVCLRNISPLYEQMKQLGLESLLTYKLSQDYLETFFSAIRGPGGFNNNPSALQFKSSYKSLLIRLKLKEFENGNCLFDSIDILHVSSKYQSIKNPIGNYELPNFNFEADHDYAKRA